jgi:hypothetical protein
MTTEPEKVYAIKVVVELTCGHWWTEHRPFGTVKPINGEMRTCGTFEHYPEKFPATYSEPVVIELGDPNVGDLCRTVFTN